MKLFTSITTAAVIGATFIASPAQAFSLGTLINAATGIPATQNVVVPVNQSTSNQSTAAGHSGASGGNGTNVSGQGNTVTTEQVTNIHHHHYTTNTTEMKTNYNTNTN